MKIEMGDKLPAHYKEFWPEQYKVFSHFEFTCSIPHTLFAVTTFKPNGKPNLNFHSWSCFQGDEGGFYAILAGIYQHTHTYANIKRDGEFCVNFLSKQHFDNLIKTIAGNEDEADEIAVAGLSSEAAVTVSAPRIKESFLTLECKSQSIEDVSGAGRTAMIIGKVQHVAAEKDYAQGLDRRYGEDGFMLNIHSPQNLQTGAENTGALATLKIEKQY